MAKKSEVKTCMQCKIQDARLGSRFCSQECTDTRREIREAKKLADAAKKARVVVKVAPGDRVTLTAPMADPRPIAMGVIGTVVDVQSDQILVDWDCGRKLSLLPDKDDYEVVK